MLFSQRVETKDGDTVVVVYFDDMDKKEICPVFKAYRTSKVAKQKPAPVMIYDYYDNCKLSRTPIKLKLIFRFLKLVARHNSTKEKRPTCVTSARATTAAKPAKFEPNDEFQLDQRKARPRNLPTARKTRRANLTNCLVH